jgi:hypothetical protein
MTKTTLLTYVEKAHDDLIKLRQSLTGNTKVTHLYIGIAISNTAALLTAPCNSLDQGKRIVEFSDEKEVFSLIQSIARSFLSSLHTTAEIVIDKSLGDNQLIPKSSIRDNAEKKFVEFLNVPEDLKSFVENLITRFKPSFEDKLNTLLKTASLEKKQQKKWRNFFKGLTIARNKVSHTDPTLNEDEQLILRKGELAFILTPEGVLNLNPTKWKTIAEMVLSFFDEIPNGA